MSIVFACIPEMLKPKIKETFPEVTFLKVEDLDALWYVEADRDEHDHRTVA